MKYMPVPCRNKNTVVKQWPPGDKIIMSPARGTRECYQQIPNLLCSKFSLWAQEGNYSPVAKLKRHISTTEQCTHSYVKHPHTKYNIARASPPFHPPTCPIELDCFTFSTKLWHHIRIVMSRLTSRMRWRTRVITTVWQRNFNLHFLCKIHTRDIYTGK